MEYTLSVSMSIHCIAIVWQTIAVVITVDKMEGLFAFKRRTYKLITKGTLKDRVSSFH